MLTLEPGCGLMLTGVPQAAVVESESQKPKPSGEALFVQKIAAGLGPLTVGEANVVSPWGAAVPVPCCRTKGFQLIGSVPETGMP